MGEGALMAPRLRSAYRRLRLRGRASWNGDSARFDLPFELLFGLRFTATRPAEGRITLGYWRLVSPKATDIV